MTNLDSILKKQRHCFANKGPSSQSYGFSSESWTIKKAECRRIDAFVLWCWRRLLRVPWAARRSNQSILKEINPEYSLEGMMLWNSNTLATWCEEPAHWKRPWCWERLKAKEMGVAEDEIDSITNSMDISLSQLWEIVEDRGAWHAVVHGVAKSRTQLSSWPAATNRWHLFWLHLWLPVSTG